jgi:signal transduction histidine kinase
MHKQRLALVVRVLAVMIVITTIVWLIAAAFSDPGYHLARLQYNPFIWIPVVTLLFDAVLIFFLIRKQVHSDEGLWLWMYVLILVVMTFSELLQHMSVTPQAALFWVNFNNLAALFGPIILIFTLSYTNPTERRFPAFGAFLLTATAIYIFISSFTNLIFINIPKAGVLLPWGWDYDNAIGPASSVAILWYMGLFGLSIARLIQFRRSVPGNTILRRQSLIFIIGICVPMIASSVTALFLPIIGITAVPPVATPFTAISAGVLLFGIFRYQILTINPAQFSNTILSLMKESVVVTDNKRNIVYLNPMAEKLLGVSNIQASQVTLSQHLSPESVTALQVAMQTAHSSGSFDLPHLDVVRSHTTPVPIRVSSSRLVLGDFETWIFVLTDITVELQTRRVIEHEVTVRTQELHQARANLVASISSLQQGFLLVNATGMIELTNDRASALFGSGGQQVTGKSLSAIVGQHDWHADLTKAVARVLVTQRAKKLETSIRKGSFYVIYITPVVLGVHPLGVTIIIEDVTEQRILDRSKDEFFSIASHELRTPLTAIRGNMSMAQQYPTLKELVNDTHAASVRLIEIVNDFLDSSKLEQGKMVFNLVPLTVGPIINAVTGDIATLIAEQHNALVVDDSVQRLPLVMADEGRLRQVLYNLLSNANKYCDNGTVTLTADVNGKKATVHIKDTGRGISAENQKLLFHKFQQAGESILTRDNTKGTGLGLYISKLLVNNMHGTVELEQSAEGTGSTFAFTLALAPTTKK